MLLQFTNTALLSLLLLQLLTGLFVLFRPVSPLVMSLHRLGAWALLALLPWKVVIAYRSLARGLRKTFDRGLIPVLSSLLAALLLLLLAGGLAWTWRLGDWLVVLGQTAISWHWVLALALIPFLAVHAWARWPHPRREVLLSRRAVLRAAGIGAVGGVTWRLAETLSKAREVVHHPRSVFTGSREYLSFAGNRFPVTTNFGEHPRRLDSASWSLRVSGAVNRPLQLSYQELLRLSSQEWEATLDCTVGWYSRQHWRGIPLSDLLASVAMDGSARFVRVWADTGYMKTFTLRQASRLLLATHLGDEPLSHQHGYPLRLVAPDWRGWFWVKWVTQVETLQSAGTPRAHPSV